MREFKFFRGYVNKTITEQFEELLQEYPVIMPGVTWDGINTISTWNTPTWIVNPDLIRYTPNYNTLPIPDYNITTTPNTGTYTIPLSGTINTTGISSLTTSNPNGITYTTTANTFYSNTGTLNCSSMMK
jgi:hypothetical protein